MRRLAADSGPLIAFARSGLLDVLRQVAGDVMVPATVFAECCRDETKPGASALIRGPDQGFFRVRPDREAEAPPGLRNIASLGSGEMAVLALASIEACPVLMDDRRARKVAASHGIPVIGSAGILVAAKEHGLVAEIAPIFAGWRSWGYFLAPALVDAVLRRAGEGT